MRINLTHEWVETWGWAGFRMMERLLARRGFTVDELEHRYAEENWSGIVGVWEVVRRVRP